MCSRCPPAKAEGGQQARDRDNENTMGQHWAITIPSFTLVMSIFCLEGAGAFLAPASFSRDTMLQQRQSSQKKSPIGSVFGRSALAPRMAADEVESAVVESNAEEAAAKAAKLRAFAAELRSQVHAGYGLYLMTGILKPIRSTSTCNTCNHVIGQYGGSVLPVLQGLRVD